MITIKYLEFLTNFIKFKTTAFIRYQETLRKVPIRFLYFFAFDEGLIEEARSLYPFRHLNALQTVGYRELFEYFDHRRSLSNAIELIKQNTRHYAKRQLTWFKKDAEIKWFQPDIKQILYYLNEAI